MAPPYSKAGQKRRKPRQHSSNSTGKSGGRLPANAPPIEVTITGLGGKGDGIGTANYTHHYQTKSHLVFVPNSLPDETIIAQPTSLTGQGIQADLIELQSASPHRKDPDCQAAPACGGCQFQHMKRPAYDAWKGDHVTSILDKHHIKPAEWRATYHAEMNSRRRTRLAFRKRRDDVLIGFRGRASHIIIAPESCVILAPELLECRTQCQDKLLSLLPTGTVGEVEITLCDNGCDVRLVLAEIPQRDILTDLTLAASQTDIIRLSYGTSSDEINLLYVKQTPVIAWQMPDGATSDKVTLAPAPASFLQADSGAETQMKADIFEALSGANAVLDLFCGSGTLSLPLLFQDNPPARLDAYDTGEDAIASFTQMAHHAGHAMRLSAKRRNLFEAPLTDKELEGFDAVIIDPPRAGAAAQMPAIARSQIAKIMMVSCNPYSFAKDATILTQAGYHCRWLRLVDQFLLTAHCELIALFERDEA